VGVVGSFGANRDSVDGHRRAQSLRAGVQAHTKVLDSKRGVKWQSLDLSERKEMSSAGMGQLDLPTFAAERGLDFDS